MIFKAFSSDISLWGLLTLQQERAASASSPRSLNRMAIFALATKKLLISGSMTAALASYLDSMRKLLDNFAL